MAVSVLLKDLPKAEFKNLMTIELNKFLNSQGDYAHANPTSHQKREIDNAIHPTVDDMFSVLHQKQLTNRPGRNEGAVKIEWLGAPVDATHHFASRKRFPGQDCVVAIIPCIVDTLSIAFQAIGVGVIAKKLASTLAIGIETAGLIALEATVSAISAATSAWRRALAIAKLGGAILRLIGFKQIISALRDNLKWYQWVLMGVIIVAQIVAWFATEGIALAAEIVILAGLIAALVIDVVNAVEICSASKS